MKSILFVCLGNICRSTLAEGIATAKVKELGLDIKIDSAGTGSWHIGEPPCNDSIKIGKIKGIDISGQKARQVTPYDFEDFDLIVCMDDKNLLDLQIRKLQGAKKLGEYGLDGADVPDPYFYNDFEGFYKVYDMIETGVENIFKEITSEA
ncbi:MAG: low molecular weight phosphotyrosine protein phosphatase [Campylobacterales bacterium]|nr:low molecular weight phosphotyrosine protein phosphatase [Campylobacterales bacterium]